MNETRRFKRLSYKVDRLKPYKAWCIEMKKNRPPLEGLTIPSQVNIYMNGAVQGISDQNEYWS